MRHHQAIIQYPDRFESEFPSVFDGHLVNLETDGFHYHGFLIFEVEGGVPALAIPKTHRQRPDLEFPLFR